MLTFLKSLGSCALLLLVLYLAGIFDSDVRANLMNMIKKPNWFWLVISIVMGSVATCFSAFKWWRLIRDGGLNAGFLRSWAYYMIGMFYNLFLPTGVGGDVVRSYALGKHTNNQSMALASVFVERYTGLVTLLLFSILAFVINLSELNQPLISYALAGFSIALAIIGWLAMSTFAFELAKRILGGRMRSIDKVLIKLTSIRDALQCYRNNKLALFMALFNSVVFYLLAIINVYATARIFSADVSLLTIILATPVIMLLMNIPVSIGNYGIMELAYVLTFELLDLGAGLGLSVAIIMRFKTFIDGAAGIIFMQKFGIGFRQATH